MAKDRFHAWMVSSGQAREPIQNLPVTRQNQDSTELPGVALHASLSMPPKQCPGCICDETGREKLSSTASKLRRAVGQQFLVDQNRNVELEISAKRSREVARTVADYDEIRSVGSNLGKGVAQLRNLLAAEKSAKVADEEHHPRTASPETVEAHAAPLVIAELDASECAS